MEQHKLNEIQAEIVTSLLDKREQINAQLAELVGMLCAKHGVDDDWLLMGNPQNGFILAPPEAMPSETDS